MNLTRIDYIEKISEGELMRVLVCNTIGLIVKLLFSDGCMGKSLSFFFIYL